MRPQDIIESKDPEKIQFEIMSRIHQNGPKIPEDLETLTYLKHYHPTTFSKIENKLMYLLGLFYKVEEIPQDILSVAYSIFRDAIRAETKHILTPVQASIRKHISENRYFSFSAPTSTGKSYLLRDLILEQVGDVVIVVPSRALIAEYLIAVKEIVANRKDILVLQFIDDVNREKTTQRVFIVTPERAGEIFKYSFNIKLFLYDEAQISEEEGARGISFDALIRRINKAFPDAKKVFSHPFILNPEAQFNKHSIATENESKSYLQNTVGKIYLEYDRKKQSFSLFSPFIKNAHLKANMYELDYDVPSKILKQGGSILVYVSKSSIYDRKLTEHFGDYVDMCEAVKNKEALSIIDEIDAIIGASGNQSEFLKLIKRGVVIHHGSVPLSVRYLIEKFTKKGFAKICFATSTLVHGVNMPFDLVWVENAKFIGSDEHKALGLKNLIGRAGRSSKEKDKFDYGYVIVNNAKSFVARFNDSVELSDISKLDDEKQSSSTDVYEFIEAVKNDTVNDEYNLPESRIQRLQSDNARGVILNALDLLFKEGSIITGDEYRKLGHQKEILKDALKEIFSISLKRELFQGEKTVLSTAITILLWNIQGKSFRELLGLRHNYLTKRDERSDLRKKLKNGELKQEQYANKLQKMTVKYSAIPYQLPNSKLKKPITSRFEYASVEDFNYDLLVYDTYDYVDKVISFSLSNVYIAAFGQYYEETKDKRAGAMTNYFKYGTIDPMEILLLRYGYSFEDIEWLKEYVDSIDQDRIVFKKAISSLSESKLQKIEVYI